MTRKSISRKDLRLVRPARLVMRERHHTGEKWTLAPFPPQNSGSAETGSADYELFPVGIRVENPHNLSLPTNLPTRRVKKMQRKKSGIAERRKATQAESASPKPELPDIDLRRREGRRLQEILSIYVGAIEGTARAEQMILARRLAALTMAAENADAALARGEKFDGAGYVTLVNAISRLIDQLGIDPSAKIVFRGLGSLPRMEV